MHRRDFIRSGSLALGALTVVNQQVLAAFTDDPWKIKMLKDNIGIFTEKGGTILFYFSGDGIVVVDSQFPEQSNHLIAELKKRNASPFRLLINTHHHGDHSSGNISFKGIVPHVLAHENSLKNQKNVAINQKTEDKQLYPDQTFGNVWSEKIGKETITLTYLGPAHTDGDALIHFEKANIVHMGDLINNRRYPYIDRHCRRIDYRMDQRIGTSNKKIQPEDHFCIRTCIRGIRGLWQTCRYSKNEGLL